MSRTPSQERTSRRARSLANILDTHINVRVPHWKALEILAALDGFDSSNALHAADAQQSDRNPDTSGQSNADSPAGANRKGSRTPAGDPPEAVLPHFAAWLRRRTETGQEQLIACAGAVVSDPWNLHSLIPIEAPALIRAGILFAAVRPGSENNHFLIDRAARALVPERGADTFWSRIAQEMLRVIAVALLDRDGRIDMDYLHRDGVALPGLSMDNAPAFFLDAARRAEARDAPPGEIARFLSFADTPGKLLSAYLTTLGHALEDAGREASVPA